MRILYGKGFDEAARAGFKPTINQNILQSMKVLIQQAEEMGFPVESEYAALVREQPDDAPVVAQQIIELWSDPGIQRAFASRASFQLNDSAS
jgi:hydrogenase maturation factor